VLPLRVIERRLGLLKGRIKQLYRSAWLLQWREKTRAELPFGLLMGTL
jgi:hypothetical protein